MDSIERAIRDALAKGNAGDRAYRERVYRSVLAALDKANAANPDLTPDAIDRRQNALKAHITAIEREYVPAVEPAMEAPAAGSRAPEPATAAPEPHVDRPIRNEPAPARFATEEASLGATADDRLAPDGDEPSGRKRPYAAMFVAVTFVAALAIGAWWASETGLFGQPDTPQPNPPAELEAEEFDPGRPPLLGPAEASQPRDWVTLFSPADPSTVVTPAGATATVGEDDAGAYLEIRSGGEAVLFDVPAAVLQSLAGGGAVFDIVARSEEGDETQISVSCNFGELGDCGRKRYLVGYEIADYLFDIEMARGSPGSSGTIAIVPDVSGGKRALHVFEIRVAAR